MPAVPMKRDEGGPIPAEWDLHCLECGYSLTGLTNRVCPECGQRFSPRETWEANKAGVLPRRQQKHTRLLHPLIATGVVAAVLGIGFLSGNFWCALVLAVLIASGEIWIFASDARPFVVRLLVGALAIFILMYAAL